MCVPVTPPTPFQLAPQPPLPQSFSVWNMLHRGCFFFGQQQSTAHPVSQQPVPQDEETAGAATGAGTWAASAPVSQAEVNSKKAAFTSSKPPSEIAFGSGPRR